ncbi:MAG TPA: GTPase [Gemmata sp.]
MSDTAVSVLTPPGTGAIATVEVRGPRAWEVARELFAPAGKPLPNVPEVNRFWFGTLGADEVVLAATAPDVVEVHCHGGRRVVRWVIEQFLSRGCVEARPPRTESEGDELLQRAPTLRTANIILDQLNGAFANEVRRILALLGTDPEAARAPLTRLAELGRTVGRHLVEPWKVAVAGPPNVGKSSLVNALAGYQRAVVSDVAGTTRDAVNVRVAFDGWPFELIDTAGLRDAEGLEAEGIRRANEVLRTADQTLWVVDVTDPNVNVPQLYFDLPTSHEPLVVANKCDQPVACDPRAIPSHDFAVAAIPVSAKTGAGLPELTRALVAHLPDVPPGAAVPCTPALADWVGAAALALRSGTDRQRADATLFLRIALGDIAPHTAGPSGFPSNP